MFFGVCERAGPSRISQSKVFLSSKTNLESLFGLLLAHLVPLCLGIDGRGYMRISTDNEGDRAYLPPTWLRLRYMVPVAGYKLSILHGYIFRNIKFGQDKLWEMTKDNPEG